MTRPPVRLVFESALACGRPELWAAITDLRWLRREMMPYLRMTAPPGVHRLTDVPVTPGAPLFVSRILYFGFLPLDHSRLTLLSLTQQQGFVEQSPMGSMRRWRHARKILAHPDDPNLLLLRDELEFEPRWFRGPTTWFVRRLFAHRHAVLRRTWNGDADAGCRG
jgi:hypothetical protein